MNLIEAGRAPRIPQPEEGASYEPYITAKPELAELDWTKIVTQRQLHNFIRGNDAVPGVWAPLNVQIFWMMQKCSKKKKISKNSNLTCMDDLNVKNSPKICPNTGEFYL